MTEIDPAGNMEIVPGDGHLIVRLPVAGRVPATWLRYFHQLAQAGDSQARAEEDAERVWIVVRVPIISDHREVSAMLDATGALIGQADAASARADAAQAEANVREWWTRRQDDRDRQTKPRSAGDGIGAEKRWPLAATLVLAMALPFLLPARFSLGPQWVVPSLEALLAGAIIWVNPGRSDRRSTPVRVLSIVLVVLLVTEAAGVTGRLIGDLIEGGPDTNSGSDLLSVGLEVWLYAIVAFSFLYWCFDGGGSQDRTLAPREFPDLAFPEQLNPHVSPPGWRPEFSDYLYLGFTNAAAFSPTDVMPLARWAKLAMAIQAFGSLAILGLVIARAVNILK
jgi:hypothetical protein